MLERPAFAFVVAVCTAMCGCEERAPVSNNAVQKAPSPVTPSAQPHGPNAVIASLFKELLDREIKQPGEDVLAAAIGAEGWLELSGEQLKEISDRRLAKRGWACNLDGVPVIVGDDGTPGSYAISVARGFAAGVCRLNCEKFVTLTSHGTVDEDGQCTQLLVASRGGAEIGLVVLNWATAAEAEGAGSLVFVTKARAQKTGLWKESYSKLDTAGRQRPHAAEEKPIGPSQASLGVQGINETAVVIFAALLADHDTRPGTDVFELRAQAMQWQKAPKSLAQVANADRAWLCETRDGRLLIGVGPDNDMFSVVVTDGFKEQDILTGLAEFLRLSKDDRWEEFGQTNATYYANSGTDDIGMVCITWGTAKQIAGQGTISFVAKARAVKEGAWKK